MMSQRLCRAAIRYQHAITIEPLDYHIEMIFPLPSCGFKADANITCQLLPVGNFLPPTLFNDLHQVRCTQCWRYCHACLPQQQAQMDCGAVTGKKGQRFAGLPLYISEHLG